MCPAEVILSPEEVSAHPGGGKPASLPHPGINPGFGGVGTAAGRGTEEGAGYAGGPEGSNFTLTEYSAGTGFPPAMAGEKTHRRKALRTASDMPCSIP